MKRIVLVCAGLTILSSAAWAQPVVNSVSNASSYTADIAQGSWFVVFGTGMGRRRSRSIRELCHSRPTFRARASASHRPRAARR